MELPKNVTRIGQADSHCKIYVEDYVMTYLKQMNTLARDKEMAIALYGVRREEESVSYIFIYGAGRMNSLQREVRHLSQAQNQEVEKIRKHYFQDYRFLGYEILNGEMIDGMHICEQGICRYVEGYAQFYEKNDLMLAYMLASRKTDIEPEKVNQEKYDKERRKREEVKNQFNQGRSVQNKEKVTGLSHSGGLQFGQMKVAVMLAFAVLCIVGVKTVSGSNESTALQTMGNKIVDKLSEDKILDDEKMQESVGSAAATTIENMPSATELTETIPVETIPSVSMPTEIEQVETMQKSDETQESEAPQETVVAPAQSTPTTYTIAQGDNLIAISVRMYGDDSMVATICELNEIMDPDDIKVGQKILLP